MIKQYSRYKAMALICLALLFLSINSAFAQSPAADYLCELGKSFYSLGRVDDALVEFNKVLLVEPSNKVAKEYINKIFQENSSFNPELEITRKPSLAQNLVVKEPAVEFIQESSKVVLTSPAPKPALSREEAMDFTLNELKPKGGIGYSTNTAAKLTEEQKGEEGLKFGPLRVSGKTQLSFGVTPNDFIWKRANF